MAKSKQIDFSLAPAGFIQEDRSRYILQVVETFVRLSIPDILETFSRLTFIKILLIDVGLSLGDAVTDLIQAFRFLSRTKYPKLSLKIFLQLDL